MNDVIEVGQPPIAVQLKQSARARRFMLKISHVDGGVSLTMPRRAMRGDAVDFVRKQEAWMRKHLSRQPDRVVPVFGGPILYDGDEVAIVHGAQRTVVFDGTALQVPGTDAQLAASLRGYFINLARERFLCASSRYAAAVGREFSRVSIRDTRSRWGSCSSQGRLMYSWRLVMAPPTVQQYVAAHEVCHLVEMNHSIAFWNQVAAICPNYMAERQWLRDHGAQLHRYKL